MKHLYISLACICLMMLLLQSCSKDNTFDPSTVIIDPTEEMRFSFDSEGVPFFVNKDLSADSKKALENNVLGYGWEYRASYVIYADGTVDSKDFWKDLYGGSTHPFYLDGKNITYFYNADWPPYNRYCNYKVQIRKEDGMVQVEGKPIFRIWSIYQVNGKWFIGTAYKAGKYYGADGKLEDYWLWSQYERMTDSKLKEYRKIYVEDNIYINGGQCNP